MPDNGYFWSLFRFCIFSISHFVSRSKRWIKFSANVKCIDLETFLVFKVSTIKSNYFFIPIYFMTSCLRIKLTLYHVCLYFFFKCVCGVIYQEQDKTDILRRHLVQSDLPRLRKETVGSSFRNTRIWTI